MRRFPVVDTQCMPSCAPASPRSSTRGAPAGRGVLSVALWAGLVAGCDDTEFNANDQPSGVFLADVLEIVDTECIGCHAGLTAEAGLDLSTDFCGTVLDGRIVAPGSPELSLMVQRMRSPSEPMPPSGALPQSQQDVVRLWIEDGAPCDGVAATGTDDTGAVEEPGAALYASFCAGCHGGAGEGGSGPAMAAVVPGRTADEIAQIARSGSGGMPPVLGDPDDAATVGAWVVEQWGG